MQRNETALIVLIATAGGSSGLESTLASLANCRKPENYLKTVVVENGSPLGAEEIVAKFRSQLNCQYLFASRANKSIALNSYLETLTSNHLVFFSDDDILFGENILVCYQDAAQDSESKTIFGGALKIKSDGESPDYMAEFLPRSMIGFPKPGHRFCPDTEIFLGANWAAYSNDIVSLGGFDHRFGPGSELRATGQESEMMKKMRNAGFGFRFIEDAIVWHFVESNRYQDSFLADRKYRSGVQIGLNRQISANGRPNRIKVLKIKSKLLVLKILICVGKWILPKRLGLRLLLSTSHSEGFLVGYLSACETEFPIQDSEHQTQ